MGLSEGDLLLLKRGAGKVSSAKGKLECIFLTHSQPLKQQRGVCCPRRPRKDTVQTADPQLCLSLSSFLNNSALLSNKTHLVSQDCCQEKLISKQIMLF